jgi:hypothetical protein
MKGRPAIGIVRLDDGVGVGLHEGLEDGGVGTAPGACVVEGCEAVFAAVGCVLGLGYGECLDVFPACDSGLVVDDGGHGGVDVGVHVHGDGAGG